MKRMSVVLGIVAASLAVLLLCVSPAKGSGCRIVVKKQAVVVEKVITPVVVATPVVTPFVAVPVAIPTFSAVYTPGPVGYGGYGGGGYAPPHAGGSPQDGAVLDALRKLNERLDRLERGGEVPRPPPAPGAPAPQAVPGTGGVGVLQLLLTKCASCHDATRSQSSGGSFTMFEGGKPRQLTAEQLGEVIRRVSLPSSDPQSMPRGGRMTDQERLLLISSLTSGK